VPGEAASLSDYLLSRLKSRELVLFAQGAAEALVLATPLL